MFLARRARPGRRPRPPDQEQQGKCAEAHKRHQEEVVRIGHHGRLLRDHSVEHSPAGIGGARGHAQCGGIRAFVDDIDPLSPGDFIGRWMAMFIKPGEKVSQREHESKQDFTTRIEKAAVFRSLENLMTFPFVRNAVEKGEMNLHGAYFGVAEGSLFVLDQATKEFRSVREG